MPNGKIQPEATERLAEMGRWMKQYGYTIYGTTRGPVLPQPWGATTQKGKTLYIHVLDGSQPVTLPLTAFKTAKWVNLPDKLTWKKERKEGTTTFAMPAALDEVDSIIEVTLK
jgi:alpha-L-fucosidase